MENPTRPLIHCYRRTALGNRIVYGCTLEGAHGVFYSVGTGDVYYTLTAPSGDQINDYEREYDDIALFPKDEEETDVPAKRAVSSKKKKTKEK